MTLIIPVDTNLTYFKDPLFGAYRFEVKGPGTPYLLTAGDDLRSVNLVRSHLTQMGLTAVEIEDALIIAVAEGIML